jgi:hypothetical protein
VEVIDVSWTGHHATSITFNPTAVASLTSIVDPEGEWTQLTLSNLALRCSKTDNKMLEYRLGVKEGTAHD